MIPPLLNFFGFVIETTPTHLVKRHNTSLEVSVQPTNTEIVRLTL